MSLFSQNKHKIVSRRWTSRSERFRGAPFGEWAQALILILGACSENSVCFPFNSKTAIRGLGERFAHLRRHGHFYLAKQLQLYTILWKVM